MAVEQDGIDVTFPASGDLSSDQFKPMLVADDGQVSLGAGNGTPFVGILQNKPAAENRSAVVRITGISKFHGGVALNERDLVTSDATGLGTATTTDAHFIVGQVVVASGGSAQIASVLVFQGQRAS